MAKRRDTQDHQPCVATTAEAFLALLKARGIEWLFANAGTDFAPIIEALVRARRAGIAMPEAVPIAHETTAVAMAHGHTLVSGRPQAVMVHVNVGMANALMGLVNAARDRVPMLFASGRTPLTESGLLGSRDLPIHWGQEMFDQAGMLRELVKWDYELRNAHQLEAVLDRALSVATSAPSGPVYLSLPREVLAEPWTGKALSPAATLRPVSDPFPDPAAIDTAARLLRAAERPLVIAGGPDRTAFGPLAALADKAALPVVHFWPARMALATTHAMHAGFDVMPRLATADVVVVLDTLVPWLPARHTLAAGAKVIEIGPDPAFHRTPMRSFPADVLIRAQAGAALAALADALPEVAARRRKALAAELSLEHERRLGAADVEPASGLATTQWVSRCLDRAKGDDAIVVGELGADPSVMTFGHDAAWFGHPISGGLGWGVPTALGAKLAARDRLVVAAVGDGSYMFANPVACHQTAAALDLPTLTVVFNNEVWNAVRKSTRAVYPKGHAAAANDMPLSSLAPSPAFEKVIEASGGLGIRVEEARDVPAALERAVAAVRGGQPALVNVRVQA